MSQFVHLHLHTEYSIVDGMLRIKSLMNQVKENQMPAIALTDHMNLFAAVKFYKAAINLGIKPILGSEVVIKDEDQLFSLVLLCRNEEGYNNLRILLSKGYLEGQDKDGPTLKYSWVQEYSRGLIVLSAGIRGDIGQALLQDNRELAEQRALFWKSIFEKDAFFIELQRTGNQHDVIHNRQAVTLASKLDIGVVASNNVRFLEQRDYGAHEARVCIYEGSILADPTRARNYTDKQFLRSPQEMASLFVDIPEALINTVEIAKRCNVRLQLGKSFLPDFPVPEGMTVTSYLSTIAKQGVDKRLIFLFKTDEDILKNRRNYDLRLKLELDVICKMGFAGYFLVVADFIKWSKDNGIPVGPGRGSGAGSLVAYALEITDLDPLKYDLLFERFLNPERVSMPDFDIDFCMEGRDRVIEYVTQKYGRESVSQIITYGSMAAKAVIRDVGRVLGHPYGFVDKIAKLIPFEIGITLDRALDQEEELNRLYQQESEVSELINLARKLEGIIRNAGKHAGGVVISPSKLTDFTPLYCEEGSTSIVTQFDKDDVESVGLVKFDFLGLRTLTIINCAVQIINQQFIKKGEDKLDISLIETDDKKTFELLKQCKTTAIFQLESRGMKDLIHRLQPDCFEDILALVALFRPGPLQSGMVDDFIDRKHGRAKVEYPHPDLESILEPTYGVILYQEQVMKIAQVLSGYSLGEADVLRSAMGKKKPEEMAKQRTIFIKGAVNRGVVEKTATDIFDLMEKFAGYGFNKSHSAAYALVSYQTAWLKTYYPAAFMTAVLSSDMDNTDKIVILIEESRAININIRFPNINQSQYRFTVVNDDTIIYGIGAIKGVGESAVEAIVYERDVNGEFTSIFDFCSRVDLKKVNKRTFEALIKGGAFDVWQVDRAIIFKTLAKAVKLAEKDHFNTLYGQQDLFGESSTVSHEDQKYIQAKPWDESVRLKFERETLGFYLTGHPYFAYKDECDLFISSQLNKLNPMVQNKVTIAGLISSIRWIMTKRGTKMAIIGLDDNTIRIDITIFAEVHENKKELLVKDELLIVEGDLSIDDYTGNVRVTANNIMNLTAARELFGKYILLELKESQVQNNTMQDCHNLLSTHKKGALKVIMSYENNTARTFVKLNKNFFIYPDDVFLTKAKKIDGLSNAKLLYEQPF